MQTTTGARAAPRHGRGTAFWQAAPFALLFLLFFIVPLCLTVAVSFWHLDEYTLTPAFTNTSAHLNPLTPAPTTHTCGFLPPRGSARRIRCRGIAMALLLVGEL